MDILKGWNEHHAKAHWNQMPLKIATILQHKKEYDANKVNDT